MTSERKFKLLFWLRLFLVTVVASYTGVILLSALALTTMITIPLKGTLPPGGPGYEDIQFRSTDGLKLSGWYLPSRNGAVIILVHSYYGDRRQTLPIAEMLARHGYGILMYDQRASGESEGEVRSLGWLDIPDVSQAVVYLQSRAGIDKKNRIGVYGCSVGGAIALAAAADNQAIAAVAADAPSPLTFDEMYSPAGDPAWAVNLPIYALYYRFVSLRAWTLPPISTGQAIRQIAPRPLLLISTGQDGELARINMLFDTAGEPKEHWNIPEASHCSGPSARPDEYEQHLVDFFNFSLLNR